MFASSMISKKKLSFIICCPAILLLFGSLSSAERVFAEKTNELPGELQDFIRMDESTGNIILSLENKNTDAVHIPLISLKSKSLLEFRIRRVNCCTKNLHTQKWSFIYTQEEKCCLDMGWTSGPIKMINVGYQDGTANAYAFADTSATIRIEGQTVKAIGNDNDQGDTIIFCNLDGEKSIVNGDNSYNMPFSMWNVPHNNKGNCDIELEFDGNLYKLEAQWPSRGAVKLILIGTGVGLVVFTFFMSLICALMELCDEGEELKTSISYSQNLKSSLNTGGKSKVNPTA